MEDSYYPGNNPLRHSPDTRTVAQRAGLSDNCQNLVLPADRHGFWWTKVGEGVDYTIRELQCGTCKEVLTVILTEHPASVDLVWPHKIICTSQGHILAKRQTGEDANMTCHGRGVTLKEATTYLEKYK